MRAVRAQGWGAGALPCRVPAGWDLPEHWKALTELRTFTSPPRPSPPLSSPKQMTSLRSCLCFTSCAEAVCPWAEPLIPLESPSCRFLLLVLFSPVHLFSQSESSLGPWLGWLNYRKLAKAFSLSVPRESESLGMALARRSFVPSTSIAYSAADCLPLTSAKLAFIALWAFQIHPHPSGRGPSSPPSFQKEEPKGCWGRELGVSLPGFPRFDCGLPARSTDF